MKLLQNIFYAYLIFINCYAYAIMWFDKHQSIKNKKRVSENRLFFVAFIFGAIGIYLGTKAPIYHKAAKAKFKIGIPLLILLNVVCVYFLVQYVKV
jgi:uncharacterized membrane protein YsdA (DUF1294 family)